MAATTIPNKRDEGSRTSRLGKSALLLAAIVGIGSLIPGSPLFFGNWLLPNQLYQGKSASFWQKQALSPDPGQSIEAIQALASLGASGGERARHASLIGNLLVTSQDPGVRAQAAFSLSKLAPESASEVLSLGQALQDEDLNVRLCAAKALIPLGPLAQPAAKHVRAAIADRQNRTNLGKFSHTIQQASILVAGRIGSESFLDLFLSEIQNVETDLDRISLCLALANLELKQDSEGWKERAKAISAMALDPSTDVAEAAKNCLENLGLSVPAPSQTAGKNELTLPPEEREYLWNTEQHGNRLGQLGFSRIGQAIEQGDWQNLKANLAPGFTCQALPENQPGTLEARAKGYSLKKIGPRETPNPAEVRRDQAWLIDRLARIRGEFGEKPGKLKAKLSLMNLGPTNRQHPEGTWEGTALLRIWGSQADGSPREYTATIGFQTECPTESRLSGGGWLLKLSFKQEAESRSDQPLFREVSGSIGIETGWLQDNWKGGEESITTGGVFLCDMNHDGRPDLLVTDINGTALYIGGKGKRFENRTREMGLPTGPQVVMASAWVDIDNDGWEDLVLGQTVFRNLEGRQLSPMGTRCKLHIPDDTSNLVVGDYDRDGKPDIYVARSAAPSSNSWLDDNSNDRKGNILLHNLGNWEFEDVTRQSGTRGGARSTFTAAWLDADNDGWPDLFVPNEFGDGVLLMNQGNGTFFEKKLSEDPVDFGTMGLAAGDLDNDGNMDLYCANMYSKAGTRVIGNLKEGSFDASVMRKLRRFVAGSQLHLNRGKLNFEHKGKEMGVAAVGWAYGPCLADFDNDGFLDIYGTAGYVSKNPDEPDG